MEAGTGHVSLRARPYRLECFAEPDSAEHMTAWWARLLDSRWITPRFSPSSQNFGRSTIVAVLLFPVALLGLVQGRTDNIVIFSLVLSVRKAVSAWSMYLRLMLAEQGLDEVSWYDMPSLTRRAGKPQQRLLAQWRLATMAKLVVSVVLLLIFAALLAGRMAHALTP